MSEDKVKNLNLIAKVLLTLYLVVGLSPKVIEIEYLGLQWLYISILNIISFGYIYAKKEDLLAFNLGKKATQFFLLFLLFLVVSFISITQAIIVSESFVQIARLINIIATTYIVFTLVKGNPKEFLLYVSKVCLVLLTYHSLVTFEHFLGSYNKPRNIDLYLSFLHYYGNINIFTASLIVKIPLVMYLFKNTKNLVWKYLSGIVLFTTIMSLYFSGSRTALLSLFIIIILTIVYYSSLVLNATNKKKHLPGLIYYCTIPLVAIFLMLNVNRVQKGKKNSLSSITNFSQNDYLSNTRFLKKNKEIAKTNVILSRKEDGTIQKLLKKSGRGNIWKSAFIIFMDHPLLGTGYGNYKLYPHKDYFINKSTAKGGFAKPVRVHNDFLEKFAETGVFGGLLYLSIFIFLFLQILSLFKTKHKDEIVFISLCGLAYSFDAFFNFPIERAPVQLFFMVSAGFLLAFRFYSNKEEKKSSSILKSLFMPLIMVLAITIFSNYLVFKNYSVRTIIVNKKIFKKRGTYKYTYNEMKTLIKDYPELGVTGVNMKHYLGSYAANDAKADEAISIFKEAISNKSHNILIHKQLGEVYLKSKKNLDSAKYYFNKIYKIYPSYKENYNYLKSIYKGVDDTSNYEKIMHDYTKSNYMDDKEWIEKAEYYYKKNTDIDLGIKILDTALAYRVTKNLVEAKKKLLDHKKVNTYIAKKNTQKEYDKVIAYYNSGKFSEAKKILQELLKDNSNDHFAIFYTGVMELSLKNYKSGINFLTEAIEKKIFKDGKPEYCRGLCYEALGQKEKAKADFRTARARNFPQAMNLPESRYKE